MIFKPTYGELVQDSLSQLKSTTTITNSNVGGITRSLVEIINKNISDFYDVLDINMMMGFLSTSQGYFLDLIGAMFNMPRIPASTASKLSSDGVQKFYVVDGSTLGSKIPSLVIPQNTTVSTGTGGVTYYVSADTPFSATVTEVYVPITASAVGSSYNVSTNTLTTHDLGIVDVFTTNEAPIVNGSESEADANYKYRLINATLAAERANEISIRLATLSVNGVANLVVRPYARGIGTYDVVVIPVDGIATDSLIASVQAALETVQAYGVTGTAIKPAIVPVDIEVRLVFVDKATDYQKSQVRASVQAAIESYIVNIPLGGTFVLNEMRQRIMDVSEQIKDHICNCYYFREEPTFLGNVEIYWDEMFYPNPDSAEAIRVL